MRKLGQHWSHRFPVSFDEENGCKIEMPKTRCELRSHSDPLDVQLTFQNEEDQGRIENVVEEHIKRFAFREPLQFVWNRAES